ncbi:MAG: tetratricopeptide repeat protein [Planctomycetota bacterium]
MIELLRNLLDDPVALELALVALVVGVAFFLLRRLSVFARELEKRRSLKEHVQGLDYYFRGEYREAIHCLQKVLENDPENIEARICLGDCFREEGDAAEAHKHHFHVYKVFGRSSTRNFWSLARDLHAQGEYRQAEEYLEKVLGADATSYEAWSLTAECQRSRGALEEALFSQRKILRLELEPAARQSETEQLATLLVALGKDASARGNTAAADRYFKEALEVAPGRVEARAHLIEVAADEGDDARRRSMANQLVELRLLGESGESLDAGSSAPDRAKRPGESVDSDLPALPAPEGPRLVTLQRGGLPQPMSGSTVSARRVRLEVDHPIFESASPRAFAHSILGREVTCRCSECGATYDHWSEDCERCEGVGTITSRHGFYFDAVHDLPGILDEIEENDRYIRALVDRLGSGDIGARDKLIDIGPRIADIVLERLPAVDQSDLLVDLLIALGPSHIPAYLEAFQSCAGPKRVVGVSIGGKGPQTARAQALERVLVGCGTVSLTYLREHWDSDDVAIRELVLDVHVLLGAAPQFDELQYGYSPIEIIARLNRRSWAQVVPLVRAAAAGGYLVETIFVDRTFNHEQAILAVFREGAELESLSSVLVTRGFTPTSLETLAGCLEDDALSRAARQVIMSFGAAAVDHLFQRYLQVPADSPRAETLRALIADLGGLPVSRLTDHFTGKSESDVEDKILALLHAQGAAVLSSLAEQYRKAGVLGFLNLDRGRLAYRRRKIIEAIARVGGDDAVRLLGELAAYETDPELRGFIEARRNEVTS